MSDDARNVPLPDEVALSLPALQELFSAVEAALVVLERSMGRQGDEYRRLDDALGRVSVEILRQLGLLGDDG